MRQRAGPYNAFVPLVITKEAAVVKDLAPTLHILRPHLPLHTRSDALEYLIHSLQASLLPHLYDEGSRPVLASPNAHWRRSVFFRDCVASS